LNSRLRHWDTSRSRYCFDRRFQGDSRRDRDRHSEKPGPPDALPAMYRYVRAGSEQRRQVTCGLHKLSRIDWDPKIRNRQCHEFDVVGPTCRSLTLKAKLDLLVPTEQ
jgi:hypothetical protein